MASKMPRTSASMMSRMVLGEIGPGEPDVGDQLVGRLRGDQHAVALDLRPGCKCPATRRPPRRCLLSDFERRGGLESRVGVDHLHFRRLHAAGHEHVQEKILRGRILRQHDFLAAQIGHGLDVLADHDAVAAVRPVDLLVDARHDAAVARLDEAIRRTRAPCRACPSRCGLRRPRRRRASPPDRRSSTSSTLNSLPSGVFQTLPGLKPSLAKMIGPQPAQTFKANRTVLSFMGL